MPPLKSSPPKSKLKLNPPPIPWVGYGLNPPVGCPNQSRPVDVVGAVAGVSGVVAGVVGVVAGVVGVVAGVVAVVVGARGLSATYLSTAVLSGTSPKSSTLPVNLIISADVGVKSLRLANSAITSPVLMYWESYLAFKTLESIDFLVTPRFRSFVSASSAEVEFARVFAIVGFACSAAAIKSPALVVAIPLPAIGPVAIPANAAAEVNCPDMSLTASPSCSICPKPKAVVNVSSTTSFLVSLVITLVPSLTACPARCHAFVRAGLVFPENALAISAGAIPILIAVTPPANIADLVATLVANSSASLSDLPCSIAKLYACLYAPCAAPPAASAMFSPTPVVTDAPAPSVDAICGPNLDNTAAPFTPAPTGPDIRYWNISCSPSTPIYSAANCTGASWNPPQMASSVPVKPLPFPITASTRAIASLYSWVFPALPISSNALANWVNLLFLKSPLTTLAIVPMVSKNPPPAFTKFAAVLMSVELPVDLAASTTACAPDNVAGATYFSHTPGFSAYASILSSSVTRGAVTVIIGKK